MIVFGMPDFLRTPKPKEPEQITTFWGFYRWRRQQGMDTNMGTALMTRRFRQVTPDRLRRWFEVYRRITDG